MVRVSSRYSFNNCYPAYFAMWFGLVLSLFLMIPSPAWTSEVPSSPEEEIQILHEVVKARILSIEEKEIPKETEFFIAASQYVTVEILDRPYKGQVLKVLHETSGNPAYDINIFVGDKVLLLLDLEDDGTIKAGYISDYSRDGYLLALAIIFGICLLIIGKSKGLKAILTLILTVFAVIMILLPGIIKGYDPVWITVLIAVAVTAITLFAISGINKKTFAALIGATGGVIMAGICASTVITLARLNGLSDEEAQMLQYLPQEINFNFQGLLFAGMIIGALGAIMDVGISIASAVQEVHEANPKLNRWQLFRAGLNVGRDVIGTMSNTLILAYTGGSLPLLLLIVAYDQPWISVINLEIISIEVVRALSGSIGLTLAIPLTAFVAAYFLKRNEEGVHS